MNTDSFLPFDSNQNSSSYLSTIYQQCGAPKKGHVCPYQPKFKRRPDEPLPKTKNASTQVEMDKFLVLRQFNLEIQGFPETYTSEPMVDVGAEPHPPLPIVSSGSPHSALSHPQQQQQPPPPMGVIPPPSSLAPNRSGQLQHHGGKMDQIMASPITYKKCHHHPNLHHARRHLWHRYPSYHRINMNNPCKWIF